MRRRNNRVSNGLLSRCNRRQRNLVQINLTGGIVIEAIGSPHFDIIEYLDGSVTDYSYFKPYRRYSE
jgi:hypothetical protein